MLGDLSAAFAEGAASELAERLERLVLLAGLHVEDDDAEAERAKLTAEMEAKKLERETQAEKLHEALGSDGMPNAN